ncbi:MAG: glycine--tRNA ligase subunit beta [Alphaproteobacteria bacterium]
MGELLLELLSEEIPARMQPRAIADLAALIRDKLAAAEIPAAELRGYVTPRRLTVTAGGIPERQPDRAEERRGPRVGAPRQAIDGFLRAAGLSSIEQCEARDTGRGEFYFAVVDRPGRPASEVLPGLLHAAIAELPWPKSMRFPAASLRWVRPLVSVVCLFDGEVLRLPLDQVPVGRTTRGHRFMSEGDITVHSATEYREKLEAAYVVLDPDRRRDMIAAGLDRLAAAEGLRVKADPGLLDEVTGLVEYPVALIGGIDAASMELPPEVLATAMRTHQRYFSCLRPDGGPAPRFLFVANNLTPDDGKTIVAGNERVLRARLADARFFWEQDREVPLASRVEALDDRVYHARLGSVRDKVRRMELVSGFLAAHVPGADAARARRAALLAKADLSTGMVGEFPELQGVMGRYYALHDGEDPRVADAVADHYKPQGPNDTCPTAPDSIVAALADKLDTLNAFFAIDEKPTGSRDPFALRRAALGVIRIVLENRLRLPLKAAFADAHLALRAQERADEIGVPDSGVGVSPEPAPDLLSFVADRLKVHLREAGVRHDLIAAVFALTEEDDLVRLLARVEALANFLAAEDGANLLVAYRRAANIVAIEQRNGGWTDGAVDFDLLRLDAERALTRRLDEAGSQAAAELQREDFGRAMASLATLRRPVDEFFDKVTVNADDPALRQNRLRLLSRIRAVMNEVADFSQIEG